MDNTEITNDTELHKRIMELNYQKEEQEMQLKRNAREAAFSVHPSMILKNLANSFIESKETHNELKSIGLHLGKDFLLSKLFGNGQTLKGFLSGLIVKKATDYLIDKNPELISNSLSKLTDLLKGDKKEQETATN